MSTQRAKEAAAIGAAAFGSGAAVTAGIAGACCVGPALAPLFLAMLGANGLIAVSGLRPYAPWMLLGSALLLAWSFRQTYRTPACTLVVRVARVVTWLAALLWVASATYAFYGFLRE